MGTWGIKTFDNDGAIDWTFKLEEADDLSVVESALEPEDLDYLEADEGETILAAGEVILGLMGKGRDCLPDEVKDWIGSHKDLDPRPLVPKAIELCRRVLAPESELCELWEESEEDYLNWRKEVESLAGRLRKSQGD